MALVPSRCVVWRRRVLSLPRLMLLAYLALVSVSALSDLPPAEVSVLHDASERGNVQEVKEILADEPEAVDDLEEVHLRTPLMVAVTRRRESVTRALLDANASLELRDRDGHTALALASQTGLVQSVRLLIDVQT